jgi:ribosomal protein L12E/L44/L45/RPP1/RPP2
MFTSFKFHIIASIFAAHVGLLFDMHLLQAVSEKKSVTASTEVVQDTTTRKRRTHQYVHNDNNQSTEVSYDGDISFTDDEKDVKSISPGGFFKFSKTTFGNRRAVHIESSSNGELKRTYYVGKTQEAYEPEGRKWLADMLPEVIANTGIGAEDRVKRIYAQKGVNGVMSAIESISSDYTKAIYFNYLIGQNGLKEKDLMRIIEEVSSSVSSDYEKSKLLQKVSSTYLQNASLVSTYMNAVKGMSSDYEKAKVLRYVLNNNKLNEANFTKTLDAISGVSSDYEKAKVLTELLNKQDLSEKYFKQTMMVVAGISSDYEKGNVLNKMINCNCKALNENFTVVLETVSKISSDYEKSKTLAALLKNKQLTEQQYIQSITAIANVHSDYEKSKLLQQLSKTMPRDKPAVMEAYKKTAKSISSDYEYRKVMTSLE